MKKDFIIIPRELMKDNSLTKSDCFLFGKNVYLKGYLIFVVPDADLHVVLDVYLILILSKQLNITFLVFLYLLVLLYLVLCLFLILLKIMILV